MAGRIPRRSILRTLIFLTVVGHSSSAKTSTVPPPETALQPISPTDAVRNAYTRVAKELRWWFPNSLAVLSAATGLILYLAVSYYDAFYLAFGLNPQEVGLSRTDILVRLLPIGIAIALVVMLIRVFCVYMWAWVDALVFPREKQPITSGAREWSKWCANLILVLVAAIGSFVLLFKGGDWASQAGKHDARRVITSPYNIIYLSEGQLTFKTTSAVSEIRWVGPKEYNIFADIPSKGTQDPHTLARVLGQNGEMTMYFDLYTCSVFIEPTIDLSIIHGVTDFDVDTSSPLPRLPTKPCTSTIK
jgi:hypothetical protein